MAPGTLASGIMAPRSLDSFAREAEKCSKLVPPALASHPKINHLTSEYQNADISRKRVIRYILALFSSYRQHQNIDVQWTLPQGAR